MLPVSPDLGVVRGEVILWGATLLALLLIPYAVARLLEIVDDEPEDEED